MAQAPPPCSAWFAARSPSASPLIADPTDRKRAPAALHSWTIGGFYGTEGVLDTGPPVVVLAVRAPHSLEPGSERSAGVMINRADRLVAAASCWSMALHRFAA